MRETKVYLSGDPVDADFPGTTMVVRTFRQTWKAVLTGRRGRDGRKLYTGTGRPTSEVVHHVTSLSPEQLGGNDGCAEKIAELIRTHWYVEVYHGKRDGGYHEDVLTRRCDGNLMSAMMVARSLGLWICARHPEKTTAEVRNDLWRRPSTLVRIMLKGGLQ